MSKDSIGIQDILRYAKNRGIEPDKAIFSIKSLIDETTIIDYIYGRNTKHSIRNIKERIGARIYQDQANDYLRKHHIDDFAKLIGSDPRFFYIESNYAVVVLYYQSGEEELSFSDIKSNRSGKIRYYK